MGLKIRLRQQGRRNSLKYRLVLADTRSPRDGKYVETLGNYDPAADGEGNVNVHADRISFWLENGAELSQKAEALVKRIAPEVIAELRKKQQAKKVKLAQKRRATKK